MPFPYKDHWIRRSGRRDSVWHFADSDVSDHVVTYCGKQMKHEDGRGRPLQSEMLVPFRERCLVCNIV